MGRRREDLDEIIANSHAVGSRLDTLTTRLEYAVELLDREVRDGQSHTEGADHHDPPHEGDDDGQ